MKIRLIGAAAALAAAALPALAAATPTIRVEGGTSNLVPETAVQVGPASKTVTVEDTTDNDTIPVAANSATAQAASAATRFGHAFGFDLFDIGGPSSFVTRIGASKMPVTFAPSWRLKVNHKVTSTGSDTTLLSGRDSVLWSFAASFDAPELDLRLSRRSAAPGQVVTATVVKFDNDGVATPAAGARVKFAGRTFVTDRSGSATLPILRRLVVAATTGGAPASAGPAVRSHWVTASLPGAVRSQQRWLCVREGSGLANCSAIAFPRQGSTVAGLRVITGAATVGVADGPTQTVRVALARMDGSRCRFLTADRRSFSAPRSCANPAFITLRRIAGPSDTSNWTLELGTSPTGASPAQPGIYRAWSRNAFGGRVETATTFGMNTVTFRVVREEGK